MKNYHNILFKTSIPFVLLLFLNHIYFIDYLGNKYLANRNNSLGDIFYNIIYLQANDIFHWSIIILGTSALLFQYNCIYTKVKKSLSWLHKFWKYHFYIVIGLSIYLLIITFGPDIYSIPKILYFSDYILIWNLSGIFNILVYYKLIIN